MSLTDAERAVIDSLDSCETEMIALLERLVNIDSGSHDRAGVNSAGDMLRDWLTGAGFIVETIPGRAFGHGLQARLPAAGARNEPKHVLLLGHRDTVFPIGEAARRPFRVDGSKAYGPGVADMKAGLVLNAFVLRALREAGGAARPVVLLCTGDEEIASPEGRAMIEAAAAGAGAVFNAEPGRPGGGVVTSRNGGLFCDVEISGVAAHSGSNHRRGRSAIEVLARKVQALHELTDYDAGITVNVGLVEGGEATNTVAPSARFGFDCRFPSQAMLADLEAAVLRVLQRVEIADTATRLTSRRLFLAVEESPANGALYDHYAAACNEIDLPVQAAFSGGSADSGFTSAMGIPTICGIGPIGEHAHTPDEVCHLDSLVPRAQALALAVLRLDG